MFVDGISTTDAGVIASTLFEQMERAWNDGDGAAFGAVFADLADFVNIRGEHHTGDGHYLGRAHQGLFDSVYAGSTLRYRTDVARPIAQGVILALVSATMVAPTGPLRGVNHARITAVITSDGGPWKVTAFHNTIVQEAT